MEERKKGARQIMHLNYYGFLLGLGFAAFFGFSTPKGNQTFEDGFFIVLSSTYLILSTVSRFLLSEWEFLHYLNFVLFAVASVGGLKSIRVTRSYLATHSDAHVEDHLKSSALVIGSMTGPAIFLFAETISCNVSESRSTFETACARLYASNWTLSLHLLGSAILFLAAGITNRHLSRDDMISLRNVDSGLIIRGTLQSVGWLVSLALFGSRPRDVDDLDLSAEGKLTVVVECLKYFVLMIWALLWFWEYQHVKFKYHIDLVLSGEREEDEIRRGWLGTMWNRLWMALNGRFLKFAVTNEIEARVSPLYRFYLFLGSLSCVGLAICADLTLLIQGLDSNLAFLIYKGVLASLIPGILGMCAFLFLDMASTSDSHFSPKAKELAAFSPALAAAASIPVGYAATSRLLVFHVPLTVGLIMLGVFVKRLRKNLMASASEVKLRDHLYHTVFPAVVSMMMPVVVMTSEVICCWLSSHWSLKEGELLRENRKCEGIEVGTYPLLLLISTVGCWPLVTITSRERETKSLENVSKLNLGCIEGTQLTIFGFYAVYALVNYSLRVKRTVAYGELEGLVFYGFSSLLLGSMVLSACKRKEEEEEEEKEGEVEMPRSSGRSTGSRGSASDRASLGRGLSMWEGGTRGARDRGSIKSASKRGIGVEDQLRHKCDEGEEIVGGADAAFNPGLI
jgi:hypothetical protein